MGFGEPEIALAYDRTCLHAGGLKWNYMDSILTSWQKKNLYTVDQIRQYDRAPERAKGAARPRDAVDPMALKAIRRRMQEKEES